MLNVDHRTPPDSPFAGSILLVEDHPATRRVLEAGLRLAGLRIDVAADGHEAIEKLAAGRPAVLVLDLVLPGVAGSVVGAAARAAYGVGLPIIAITAYGGAAEKGRAFGACAAFDKPFELRALVDSIRTAL
jgi:DNA-binding response OmpR family regulator